MVLTVDLSDVSTTIDANSDVDGREAVFAQEKDGLLQLEGSRQIQICVDNANRDDYI